MRRVPTRGFRAVLLATLAAAACQSPPAPDPMQPRAVSVVRSWDVYHRGRRLGVLHELEIADPAAPVTLYRAEARGGQWLGFVDDQGRVWQRVPFADQELFRGVHPMETGVALLYEVEPPVELRSREPADGTVPPIDTESRP